MFGLVFSRRHDEQQPWWDDDPSVRARNVSVERALSRHMSVLNLTGGDGPEPPDDGVKMPPIVAAALKYGLTPVLLAWLLVLGVTEFRTDLKASKEKTEDIYQTMRQHMEETRAFNARMERMQEMFLAVLEASCVNQAVGRDEQQRCLQPRRGGI